MATTRNPGLLSARFDASERNSFLTLAPLSIGIRMERRAGIEFC
jgi:hypothetical protein